MLLMGTGAFSQSQDAEIDRLLRLWKTGDTTALKQAYEASKVVPVAPQVQTTPTYEQLLHLQREHEEFLWDMEVLRLTYQQAHYNYGSYRVRINRGGL